MQRRTKATIAAAIGTAMALVSQSPATALSAQGWSLSSSVQTATQITSTASVKPLVGDFNGDHRSDVFFYAPGTSADYLWTSKPFDSGAAPGDRFSVKTMPITGTYTPLVGDFDGNGASDIFWYAPGTLADSVWYFQDGNLLASVAKTVNGTYQPVAGDFDHVDPDNSKLKDDILWYSTAGSATLWSGLSNRTFTSRGYSTAPPPANAKVLMGNFTFDPDHTGGRYDTDLLFYVPGTGADSLWTGEGTGEFIPTAKTINGTYVPVVGNFDLADVVPDPGTPVEAGLTDIVWYAPGTTKDSVWMSTGSGFTSQPLTINASGYKPFVIPNILGGDTIMWNNPTGGDFRWQTGGATAFEYTSLAWPGADMGTRTPLLGSFDDDQGRLSTTGPIGTDVLWAQAGDTTAQKEVLWAGDDSGKWVLQTEV